MTDKMTNRYFQLNAWSRTISTCSTKAQTWFDRGLNWTYGYNHEEAVHCFREALRHDPDCAMAWWGIAYASGPFYNRPWIRFTSAEVAETLPLCHEAACRAVALSGGTTPVEQALIHAILHRYPQAEPALLKDLNAWHNHYTGAMRAAHRDFPDDPDVAALFAEAAVTRTPRKLWDLRTGEPMPDADTLEVLEVLERSIDRRAQRDDPPHPGLLHIYIHLLEMSPTPEKALIAADRVRDLARDEGHFHHMPAHIYVQCGDYAQSVAVSQRAIEADDAYLAVRGADNFYTTARCHDLHLLMFAAMFLGQYSVALRAADRITQIATPDLVRGSFPFMAAILDGYSAMRIHVLVRFGKWHELLSEAPPPDPALTPIRTAMHHYGQGVAHAALGQIEASEEACAHYAKIQDAIPPAQVFLSNPVRDILAVGAAMLEGELEYRKHNYEVAFAALRRAVERDDALAYTEPWAWMHPPRHALGALLAEQGRFNEAEKVYRTDLGLAGDLARCCQHPDNVWALSGLLECVERQGEYSEVRILRQKLTFAQARADVPISTACYCASGL
jgi:tetratricopeptide (TPR) repeat protein